MRVIRTVALAALWPDSLPLRRAIVRASLPVALLLGGCRDAAVEVTPTPVAVMSATPSPTAPPTASLSPTPTVTPAKHRPIPPGYRVQIPRLGIDLPMQEGDFARDREGTPERAALHYPGSAHPGEPGNTYVYAHARVGMFLALWQARVGDEVRVVAPDRTVLRYAVDEVHPRVAADDLTFLWNSPDERLTLQTSTGPTSRDPRFIVVARRRD